MSPLAAAQRTLNLLAIQKPAVAARMIRQVANMDVVIVLDLEDSLWDVVDPAHTSALKAAARQDLLALAGSHPEIFRQLKIGVRINKADTPEFTADLETLAEIAKRFPWSVIVPTKVESALELRRCLLSLAEFGVACQAITPIVETLEGVAHLPEIASAAADMGMPAIIYGHYDYCLSAGLWPFPDFDEINYWELIEPFIAQVEDAGLSIVQPPFFSIYNDELFLGVLGEMGRRCRLPYGVLTFGPRQTRLCADVSAGRIQAGMVNLHRTEPMPPDLKSLRAIEVIQAYDTHRMDNKGFAVNPRTGRFIAPHQYAVAKAFLGEIHV
jgi:citrate lyase beta subunit